MPRACDAMSRNLRGAGAAVGLTLLAAFFTTGCSQVDPSKELQKVASWAATARLVADARLAGSVSARYTTQLLRTAIESLDQQSRSLRTARLESSLRNEALQTTFALRQTVSAMSAAADDDIAALARYRSRLEPLERQVKALSESAARQ